MNAQPAIEDPGYCAEFYPNANCRNLGPGNPYTDGGYYRFAAKVLDEKIRVFQFPEEEDVVPLPLPKRRDDGALKPVFDRPFASCSSSVSLVSGG